MCWPFITLFDLCSSSNYQNNDDHNNKKVHKIQALSQGKTLPSGKPRKMFLFLLRIYLQRDFQDPKNKANNPTKHQVNAQQYLLQGSSQTLTYYNFIPEFWTYNCFLEFMPYNFSLLQFQLHRNPSFAHVRERDGFSPRNFILSFISPSFLALLILHYCGSNLT